MPHHHTASRHAHSHSQQQSAETHGSTIHWARFYDFSVKLLALGSEEQFRQASIELAQIQPGERVLDIGCGTGSLTLLAARLAGSAGAVFGVDPAAEMVRVAREKAEKEQVDVTFSVGAAEQLGFPDADLDLVMNSLTVHHLPGEELKRQAFSEMYRVLKPGGRLLIVDFQPPTGRFSRWLLRPFLKGMLDYQIATIVPLVEAAGFEGVTSGRTRHRMASYIGARKA